jgi:hypothetical protein
MYYFFSGWTFMAIQQKQLIVSQKEIDQRLIQLNLTHDPALVRSRRQWFSQNKVKIFTAYGRTYQEPSETKAIEIITHIQELNTRYSELKDILRECVESEVQVSKVDGRYVGSDKKLIENANKALDSMKAIKAWFEKRRLLVKRTEVAGTSLYRYEGEEKRV